MTAWLHSCVQTDLPAFTAYDAKSIQAIAAECEIDYVALTYTCDESDVVCHIWPGLHVVHPLSILVRFCSMVRVNRKQSTAPHVVDGSKAGAALSLEQIEHCLHLNNLRT